MSENHVLELSAPVKTNNLHSQYTPSFYSQNTPPRCYICLSRFFSTLFSLTLLFIRSSAFMAEDLDDGELWLPSDIVPDLGLRRHPKPAAIHDPLPDRLAGLALLDPARYPVHSNPLLGYQEASRRIRFNPAEIPSRASFLFNGIAFSPSPRPVYQLNHVDSFGVRRARLTQRQPERVFPARFNGSGRERTAGTGVFLPRVVNNNEFRKKSSTKGGEQPQQKQQPIRNAVGGRQGMSFQPPSSEMCLPQDWTY